MTEAGAGPPQPESQSQWPQASRLADQLVEVSGGTIRAVLLYGSHLLRTSPDPHSAVDFVVIVDDYRNFYVALDAAGELHRPVALMAALAKVLAPNVLAFAPDEGRGSIAKYQLVSRADFERALGPKPPDHFLLARMIQRVAVLRTADAAETEWVETQLARARAGVLAWIAPYLEEPVDAGGLGRRLLEVCYASEIRPESAARSSRVFEAQAEHFRHVFAPVLEAAADGGVMRRDGDRYMLAAPVPARERLRWRRHFRRSKARATARWFKHTATFVNWLPYIVRKVERHTGRTIELTRLERKLPLIFLWPRLIHVLLTRPRREIRS